MSRRTPRIGAAPAPAAAGPRGRRERVALEHAAPGARPGDGRDVDARLPGDAPHRGRRERLARAPARRGRRRGRGRRRRRRRRRGRRAAAAVGDDVHEDRADVDHVADVVAQRPDDAVVAARDLHGRLVALDRAHGLELLDGLAGRDVPLEQLHLRDALADVRQGEFVDALAARRRRRRREGPSHRRAAAGRRRARRRRGAACAQSEHCGPGGHSNFVPCHHALVLVLWQWANSRGGQ